MNIYADFWTCPLCDRPSERLMASVVGCPGVYRCSKCDRWVDEVNKTYAIQPFDEFKPIPTKEDK